MSPLKIFVKTESSNYKTNDFKLKKKKLQKKINLKIEDVKARVIELEWIFSMVADSALVLKQFWNFNLSKKKIDF